MPRDAALTPAMTVRAEAMRLAIACVERLQDATFADVVTVAEQIERWLYEAKRPAIVRAGSDELAGTELNGHA